MNASCAIRSSDTVASPHRAARGPQPALSFPCESATQVPFCVCLQRSTTPSLTKDKRILRSAEFRKVYQTGVRVTSRHFAAFCLATPGSGSPSRYGFTLPRAIGTAVTRNRIRRRLREAVRAHLDQLPEDWAIVFNPRRNALDASFSELSSEVSRLFERCKKL